MLFTNLQEAKDAIFNTFFPGAHGIPITLEVLRSHFNIESGGEEDNALMDAIVALIEEDLIEISGEGWLPIVRGRNNET